MLTGHSMGFARPECSGGTWHQASRHLGLRAVPSWQSSLRCRSSCRQARITQQAACRQHQHAGGQKGVQHTGGLGASSPPSPSPFFRGVRSRRPRRHTQGAGKAEQNRAERGDSLPPPSLNMLGSGSPPLPTCAVSGANLRASRKHSWCSRAYPPPACPCDCCWCDAEPAPPAPPATS